MNLKFLRGFLEVLISQDCKIFFKKTYYFSKQFPKRRSNLPKKLKKRIINPDD